MRIGIELRQIIPGACGGIVPHLQGVLEALFAGHAEHHYDLYCIRANTSMFPSLPPHVRLEVLPEETYFDDLDRLAAGRGTDALFRSYPWDAPLAFPGGRQVVFIPDLQHEYFPEFFEPASLEKRRACFRRALEEYGAIGTNSEHARATLVAHPQTRTRDIFLMPPALMEVPADPSGLTDEERASVPAGDFFFFPGNLWPHKNHRRALRAFRLLLESKGSRAELILTGHPDGWEALRGEFGDLPVRHLGFVRRALLQTLMERATALLFFSLFEGFGMPLLEAFRAGTPVLCSNTTSLPEVGRDAIVSCDPTDVGAMSDAMHRILTEKGLRGRLAVAGARRLAHYSWNESADNLLAAFCRVTAPQPAAPVAPAAPAPRPLTVTARTVRAVLQPRSVLLPALGRRAKKYGERVHADLSERAREALTPVLPRHYQHPPRPMKTPRLPGGRLPDPPPVISIVTPSFNHAHYLERTLKSVLDQNYPSLEYVVQDGGSTDGTGALLDQYRHRLAHCESRPDGGQANAIRLGFRHTTGDIMAYLNSDDLLLPGSLAHVARYFDRHPEVDAVYSHRVIIDHADQEVGRWVLPPHDGHVMVWVDFVPQETLFWRRRIWDRVGGVDDNFQFAMDWDMLLRFHDAGARIVRLPCFLGAFRVHPQQKTSARMADLGAREIGLLRERSLGRPITESEAWEVALPYVRRHVWYHLLHRVGVMR